MPNGKCWIYQQILKAFIFIIFNNITLTSPKDPTPWKNVSLTWPEDPKGKPRFPDKVVFINLVLPPHTLRNGSEKGENHTVIATGVIISNNQVLTSFNAFRNLVRDKTNMKSVVVTALNMRIYYETNITYNITYSDVACGRQVVPMRDNDIKDDDWHGKDHLHSPLHDLMVLRLAKNISLEDKNPKMNKNSSGGKNIWKKLSGPLLTVLAESDQDIGRDVQVASVGHENDKHIQKNVELLRHDFEPDENVIVDCDQWIPRDWGYFICLRNVNDFEAIASGAVLFHNFTLYGVGSFALRKGKKGVLVFTDVRRYYDLIQNTCTLTDQI